MERVAMGAEGPTAGIIGLSFMDGKYIGDEGRNRGKQFCQHFNRAQIAFPGASCSDTSPHAAMLRAIGAKSLPRVPKAILPRT